MRGLLISIALLVLAVQAVVGQSGLMVCLGGVHGHRSESAAGDPGCSHAGQVLVAAERGHTEHGVLCDGHSGPIPQDRHDDDCSCTDLLIGLREEVAAPRGQDEGRERTAAALTAVAFVPSTWWTHEMAFGPSMRSRRPGAPPGVNGCCLGIVRSTRLLT